MYVFGCYHLPHFLEEALKGSALPSTTQREKCTSLLVWPGLHRAFCVYAPPWILLIWALVIEPPWILVVP